MAQSLKAEVLELNASDLRNKESIESVMGSASQQASLFNTNKLLLIDEVDGVAGTEDRGGLTELANLIGQTKFPIIFTANNIWDKKFNDLRKKAELIELKELSYLTILNILKTISQKEELNLPEDLLKSVAIKARGDARAALNDLQTINIETGVEDLAERDKEQRIFDVLKIVFKNMPNFETLQIYDKINMPIDEIFLWLEENIPKEYRGKELYKAFEALSKADVFRGRIHRQQHWRFLIYENALLSAGISASKDKARVGFTAYTRPSRILSMWLINQKQKYKKSISEKFAVYAHIGTKRAMHDFPIIKTFLRNPINQKILRLEEEEIEFLKS